MQKPLISVLMPVYRTDRAHLHQAIDSILNQTVKDFEFLIMDDCPTDRREDVVLSYNDNRIKYIKNPENLGIAKARNLLIDMAQGDFLAVMDHDDIAYPNRFEKQLAYMQEHLDTGICGSACRRFGDLKKKGIVSHSTNSDEIASGLFFKCMIHHPSAFIRAEVLKKNKIYYSDKYVSSNDRRLYLDIMSVSKLANLPDVLMDYRMHANMTSKQAREKIVAEQKLLRDEMLLSMGLTLDEAQKGILNDYITKGRCRIKDKEILKQVESVLSLLNKANQKSEYFPVDSFEKLCAQYLVKRCLNAAVFGRIGSKDILKKTDLKRGKVPFWLKVLNFIY
ncbi:MAG: glycosyltransferase family 2 protein [Alphaproteobacteria bacterium]|nr:glycosyltransferase family 2 protein [Alphaproteobacteria bacterium]